MPSGPGLLLYRLPVFPVLLYVDANGISQVFRRSIRVLLLRSSTPAEPMRSSP